MCKWEYKKEVTSGGVITLDKLNELGALGWENYDHEGNIYYFKRQMEKAESAKITAPFIPPGPANNKSKKK